MQLSFLLQALSLNGGGRAVHPISWIEMGVLDDMLAVLAREADLEWLMIDSTIVRAHQHAAGARQSKGGGDAQGLGRSRGGLSTKIHAAGDALGLPVRLTQVQGNATTLPSRMN
ncbi:hypothetical protein J2S34_000948 [Nitrobacter winogradskyi]|uniref:Uncharacterized protein n=1 Tax=Nitrobacter winogradskyi TaxID=913 RepID=A0ACC6AFQ1_NITWI|nr:hypothetical protein [Nitrobacter winogradskyi]